MRERGLKPIFAREVIPGDKVAPHAGAWIETIDKEAQAKKKVGRSPCGSVD